jgi:molybdopterin synthase catalytic subunit
MASGAGFSLSAAALDIAALRRGMAHAAAGALVSFEGWVRDHNEGKAVARLEYEAYPALAWKEGERILAEAASRFGVRRIECVHRTGLLEIGDTAVWVGVCSDHRGEAFDACRWVIDQVKHRVPIWKCEHYLDGSRDWVSCHACMHSLDGIRHSPQGNA